MIFKNPKSKRENSFRKIYDRDDFKAVLGRKNQLPPFPFLLDVELTNICNLKCLFCGQQVMQRPRGFMSEDIFKKIVDECARYKTPIRLIRWGEPFLHPRIIDFIGYAKGKGLMVHITNNGLAITKQHMKDLVKLGVDSIIFSFQGATKEQYEIIRNNNRYDELKANIFKLIEIRGKKAKPFIHVSSTMTNETKKEIEDFVGYWGKFVDSVGVGKTNLSRLDLGQIKSLETIGKFSVLKKQETIKKCYKPCTEVYQKLSVDWDGKVSCCCGDYDNFLVVGDLKKDSLYNIWNNSQKLKIIRELLDDKQHKSLKLCSTCYHVYDEF